MISLAATAAVGAAAALSGCGRTGDTATDPAGSTSAAPVADGAFPVTLQHKFGETTVTKAPSRVVCVGLTDQDALLALGVVPVATSDWFGTAPGRIFSWATDELGDAPVPEVLSSTNGVPIEKIASLAPDLIVGQYSGLTEKEYKLLSAIAPTVAQSADYVDYGTPWEVSTVTIGTAIGQRAAAEKLVASVQQRIKAEAEAHPEFAGRSAAVVTLYEGIFVYGPQDPRGRMLADLGFTFPEALRNDDAKEFGWSVSTERATDVAPLDAVVWLATDAQLQETLGDLWVRSRAAKQGRAVLINEDDGDYYIAQSFVTALSIPYVLDRYVPQLAAAVDGDRSTSTDLS